MTPPASGALNWMSRFGRSRKREAKGSLSKDD
jgi:hypothetical protein